MKLYDIGYVYMLGVIAQWFTYNATIIFYFTPAFHLLC